MPIVDGKSAFKERKYSWVYDKSFASYKEEDQRSQGNFGVHFASLFPYNPLIDGFTHLFIVSIHQL